MSTLRRKSIMHTIDIGGIVFSEKVGKKEEFWGRVTFHGHGGHGAYYHVMDFQDGTDWHRSRAEILAEEAYAALVVAA